MGEQKSAEHQTSWRRILLLLIAITVHNIPGNTTYFLEIVELHVLLQTRFSNCVPNTVDEPYLV